MKRGLLPLGAGLLALLFGGCYTPVFDPSISAGALFEAALGAPSVSIGPLPAPRSAELGWRFLPDRSPGARQGLLEARSSQGSSLLWLLPDGGGGSSISQEFMQTWLPAGSQEPFAAMSVPGSPLTYLYLESQNLKEGQQGISPAISKLALSPSLKLAGAGVAQIAGTSDLGIALLATDGTNWNAYVGPRSSLSGAPYGIPKALPLPSGGTFFGFAATGPLYYGEPGGNRAAVWDPAAASWTLWDLGAPLVGLLSDGHLVAQDEYSLSVWTSQGKRVLSIPAGNIRFAEEITGPDGQVVVLTRCLELPGKDAPTLRIDSWELSLADFLGL